MKIVFNREECIGCGSCGAICPQFWEMAEDGKTDLKGAAKNGDEKYELEIAEENKDCNKEAADICPLQLIEIKKEE